MIKWAAGGFIAFLLYVIYLANSGVDHIFFQIVEWLPYGDKIGHLVLIGTLALLINLAIGHKPFSGVFFGRIPLLTGTVIVTLIVLLEELSQLFLIYRTFDLGDLTFDLIGILIANWLAAKRFAHQTAQPSQ